MEFDDDHHQRGFGAGAHRREACRGQAVRPPPHGQPPQQPRAGDPGQRVHNTDRPHHAPRTGEQFGPLQPDIRPTSLGRPA